MHKVELADSIWCGDENSKFKEVFCSCSKLLMAVCTTWLTNDVPGQLGTQQVHVYRKVWPMQPHLLN